MTIGEIYGTVKPILYPQSLPDRGTQCRDISIVKRLLKGFQGEDIVRMCGEMRRMVDAGELPEWAPPGGNFQMRLIIGCGPAKLLSEADKTESQSGGPAAELRPAHSQPVSIASLLGNYLA